MNDNVHTMWAQTLVRNYIYLIKYARANHLSLVYIHLSNKNNFLMGKKIDFINLRFGS